MLYFTLFKKKKKNPYYYSVLFPVLMLVCFVVLTCFYVHFLGALSCISCLKCALQIKFKHIFIYYSIFMLDSFILYFHTIFFYCCTKTFRVTFLFGFGNTVELQLGKPIFPIIFIFYFRWAEEPLRILEIPSKQQQVLLTFRVFQIVRKPDA